ncbi:MAG TPA: AMP-binding protein, partial [Candidatus Deferrimicrobiaceae bacterium]|nr:AMP-binding protein [Candidatus Deferrimicrobiaceae bacterium]
MNIGNILTTSAQKDPGKPAIVCDKKSISYGELDRSTTSLARWLLRQDLKTGDRIAIYWPNSIEIVKLFFAAFKAGMIAVPINVRMKTPEVAYILEHSKAAVCFAHPDLLSVAEEARSASWQFNQIQTTLEAVYEGDSGPLPVMNDEDPAFLLYTSGTTARPKGVTHTHRTLSECVKLTHAMVPDGDWQSALVMTQMAFVSAMCLILLPAVAKGGTVVSVTAFDAPLVLDLIERFQVTYAFALPSMVQAMIEEQARKPRQVRSLRSFLAAGDRVPVSTQQRFQSLFGISVREGFGMTEMCPSMANPADAIRSGSLGKPLPGVKARVVDAEGEDAFDGQIGELILRSPAKFAGYWDDPAATREAVRDGWLHTGDLVRRDADGYLWFEGRKKEIIIRDGVNISPQEVEEA